MKTISIFLLFAYMPSRYCIWSKSMPTYIYMGSTVGPSHTAPTTTQQQTKYIHIHTHEIERNMQELARAKSRPCIPILNQLASYIAIVLTIKTLTSWHDNPTLDMSMSTYTQWYIRIKIQMGSTRLVAIISIARTRTHMRDENWKDIYVLSYIYLDQLFFTLESKDRGDNYGSFLSLKQNWLLIVIFWMNFHVSI